MIPDTTTVATGYPRMPHAALRPLTEHIVSRELLKVRGRALAVSGQVTMLEEVKPLSLGAPRVRGQRCREQPISVTLQPRRER